MWPAMFTDRCSVEDRKYEPARLQCRNATASANGGVDPKIVPQSQHPKQDLQFARSFLKLNVDT